MRKPSLRRLSASQAEAKGKLGQGQCQGAVLDWAEQSKATQSPILRGKDEYTVTQGDPKKHFLITRRAAGRPQQVFTFPCLWEEGTPPSQTVKVKATEMHNQAGKLSHAGV